MAIPRKSDEWPTPYEYDQALLSHGQAFADRDIQGSRLLKTAHDKPARLNGSGSPHVCVYRLDNWVVRCFTADPPDILPPEDVVERYEAILTYLQRPENNLPFLVKHEWVEHSISMRGTYFPFLKLPYLSQAKPLGTFLSDLYEHSQQQQRLPMFAQAARKLAQEWLHIVQEMEKRSIAHGDLDTSNILVRGTYPSLSLVLIDYDGMYVPTFAGKGMRPTDQGHENFQPVHKGIRTFGPAMDRFSSLIIYISLRALELKPTLWEACDGRESCLLLGFDDFEHLGQSKRFSLLYQESLHDPQLHSCLDELKTSQLRHTMPPSLHEILNVYVEPQAEKAPSTESTSGYIPIPPAIPLDWALNEKAAAGQTWADPSSGHSPQPDPDSLTSIPMPAFTGRSQTTPPPWQPPSVGTGQTQRYAPSQSSTQYPTTPTRRRSYVWLFWLVVVLIILAVVIALIIHAQQPAPSGFVFLTMVFSPLLRPAEDRTEEELVAEKEFIYTGKRP